MIYLKNPEVVICDVIAQNAIGLGAIVETSSIDSEHNTTCTIYSVLSKLAIEQLYSMINSDTNTCFPYHFSQ